MSLSCNIVVYSSMKLTNALSYSFTPGAVHDTSSEDFIMYPRVSVDRDQLFGQLSINSFLGERNEVCITKDL
jgi:hypothetical protein